MSPTFSQVQAFTPDIHRGWLHTLDPRSKMVLALVGVVCVLNARAWWLLVIFISTCLLLISARLTPRHMLAIGRNLTPLIVLVLITWPLFYGQGDEVWFAWWFIRLTRAGVVGGITTALRILSLVYVLALLAATTNQAQMVSALRQLRVPYAWALTISLSLRYIPTLYGLYRTVTEAQLARAWSVPQGHFVQRARGYLPVLIAVLIGAIRLSDQTAMALMARGFDAHQPRVLYREVKFKTRDWWVVGLALVGLVVFIVLR